jgi:hypothetical protein
VPAVPLNVEVGLAALPKLPPVPLWTLHIPVPTLGVLAARVTEVWPQVAAPIWSGPAFEGEVLLGLKVICTSSVLAVQGAFVTVQRRT